MMGRVLNYLSYEQEAQPVPQFYIALYFTLNTELKNEIKKHNILNNYIFVGKTRFLSQ